MLSCFGTLEQHMACKKLQQRQQPAEMETLGTKLAQALPVCARTVVPVW